MNTELKYRTFSQLINEVATDLTSFNTESLLEPSQLIKVVQRVSYDLGLRIHGTKEKVLRFEKGRVKLPDDFYVLNYAYLCGKYMVSYKGFTGRHTENVIVGSSTQNTPNCPKCYKPATDCGCEITYVQECKTGENIFVRVVENTKVETRIYETFDRVAIATDTGKKDALGDNSRTVAYIKNGYVYLNMDNGTLFISYQGALEDDEGNLLVLDHPMINEYYEYAIKQRVLENLYINGEDVIQRLQLVQQQARAARNNALTIVNTPNFGEMYQNWLMNRKAMYHRYYNMFKTWDGV